MVFVINLSFSSEWGMERDRKERKRKRMCIEFATVRWAETEQKWME